MLDKRVDEGLTWGTTKDSALLTYLEQSKEEKYKEILEYIQSHEEGKENDVNQLVRDGNHALIGQVSQ